MTAASISEYWNDWVIKAKQGNQFSFLSIGGEAGQAKESSDDDDEEQENPPKTFAIDDGFHLPHLCITGSTRTQCLRLLGYSGVSPIHKVFRKAAKLVDNLEVSYIKCDL